MISKRLMKVNCYIDQAIISFQKVVYLLLPAIKKSNSIYLNSDNKNSISHTVSQVFSVNVFHHLKLMSPLATGFFEKSQKLERFLF